MAIDNPNISTGVLVFMLERCAVCTGLNFSLSIQKDENEALKAALQSTLKAKEEDLRMYTEMMEETKKVFLQALRQHKQ